MARVFATSINLSKNELQNARIQNLSSNPSSPVAGQIYFNTTDNELRYYDGSSWVSGSSVEFGDTASRPAASKAGQLYVDTEAKVVYVDNGTAWVQGTISQSDVDDAIGDHASDTVTHGVSGNIVGTSDTQTLSNKTVEGPLAFKNPSTTPTDGEIFVDDITEDFVVRSYISDLVLDSQSGDIQITPDGVTNVNSQLNVFGNLNTATIAGSALNGADGSLTIQNGAAESQIHIDGPSKNIELLPASGSKAFYGSAATAGNEIAKISDIQATSSGLSWKQAVNLLSTSNIPLSGDLVTDLSSIDGHPIGQASPGFIGNGYRILLTGQSTSSQNGIYVLNINEQEYTYTLTRSLDSDVYSELIGAALFIIEGTQYGATSWVQSNHYITDFDNQEWVQFSGQGTYIGSDSIQVDGNQINAIVDNTRGIYVDGDGIYLSTGLGTQFGIGGAIEINAGTGFDVSTGVLQFASGYGVRKYAASIGDNTSTSADVTHNFNTKDVTVTVFDNVTDEEVFVDVKHYANKVTISCATTITTNQYRVVIVG